MTDPAKQQGSDPVGEFQRWLVRSGARSVTRQVRGQIRTALGGGRPPTTDVWEAATSEYDEAPECAWCPICRARRRLRESGPGLSSGVAAAADAVGVVMQDAMSAFEAAVTAAAGRQTRPRPAPAQPSGEVWDEATDGPAAAGESAASGGSASAAWPKQPPAGTAKPAASSGSASAAWPKQPSAGTAKPAAEPAKRPAEPAKRPAETTKRPAEAAQPSAETAKPPAGAEQPSAGTAKSSDGTAKPPAGTGKPSAGTAKPPAGAKHPSARTKRPSAAASEPTAETGSTPDKPTDANPDEAAS